MKFIAGLCALLSLSAIAGQALAGTEYSAAKDVIAPAPAAPCTLFPPDQWSAGVFGAYEGGVIDVHNDRSPVYVTRVKNLPVRFGPGGTVIVIAGGGGAAFGPERLAFRTSAKLRPAFATTVKLTTVKGSPVLQVTQRTKSYRDTQRIQHNAAGGGAQISYFFDRYFGLALEGDFMGGSNYLTQLSGQFIARYPFEFGAKEVGYSKDDKNPVPACPTWGLAPYFICGGGAQWDGANIGLADVGGGVEVRCKEHWGMFTDGRWFVRNTTQNFAAVRLGIFYTF